MTLPDMNTATLEQLSGSISPQLAQRVAEERTAQGPFHSWADLKDRVPGLGDKKLEKLQAGFVLAAQASPQLQSKVSTTAPASRQLQSKTSSNARVSSGAPPEAAAAPRNVLAAALGSIKRSLSRQLSKRQATADDSALPVVQPADGHPAHYVGPLQAALFTPPPAAKKTYAAAVGPPQATAAASIKAAKPAPRAQPTTITPPPSSSGPPTAPAAPVLSDAAFSEQVASAQQQRQARASLGRGFSLKDRSEAPAPPPQGAAHAEAPQNADQPTTQEPASKLAQILLEDSVTTHSHQQTPRGKEASSAGQRWWEGGPEGAPFPAEFQEQGKWPGKTKAVKYSYFYDYLGPGSLPGTFTYKGEHLAAGAAAALRKSWADRYPAIEHSNQNGNGRETARHRSNATGSPSHRNAVWQDLLQLDGTLRIPLKLRKRFRSDAYGNVVALHAKGDAVCSFDVDHIFPWSRGGLSVPENLMALYWGANRHVKSNKIRNSMTEVEVKCMQCGLSVDHFLELTDKMATESGNRRTETQMLNHLDTLLTTPFCTKWDLSSVLAKGSVFLTLHTLYQAHLTSLTGQQAPAAASPDASLASPPAHMGAAAAAAGAGHAGPMRPLFGAFGRISRGSRDAPAVV